MKQGIYRITPANEKEIERFISSDEIGYFRDSYAYSPINIWMAIFKDTYYIICGEFMDDKGKITFVTDYINDSISSYSLRETLMRLADEMRGDEAQLQTILNMEIFPNYVTPEDTRLFSCVWLPDNYGEVPTNSDGLYPASFFTEEKGYSESDLNIILNMNVGNVWAEDEIGQTCHFVTRVK